MSACDMLRPKAAGVASLPEGDPDRIEYLAHAQGCPDCMAALRQGELLMRKLDQVKLPAPSQAALDRARAAVLAEIGAQVPARLPQRWALKAAAAVAGFFVPVLFARHLELAGISAAIVVLGVAGILAATAGTLRAGALVVLAASAGFAFAAGGVPGVWPQASDLVPVELMCTSFELIGAALPLAAAAWAWRKNPQPGALAQAAAAGALAGQAALHLACPGRHDAMHLWMFHVSGVLLAAVAGWLLEGQLKSARS